MENQETLTGNEGQKNRIYSGNVETNPSRPDKTQPNRGTPTPNEENQKSFDRPNQPAEINPGKLDNTEIDLDRSGVDNSKGHEPYEFKNQGSRPVTNDTNQLAGSVDDSDRLVGQGGYGAAANKPAGGNAGTQKGTDWNANSQGTNGQNKSTDNQRGSANKSSSNISKDQPNRK